MNKLEAWLEEIDCEGELETVDADASARKYYRLKSAMHSGIVMDASALKASLDPYIEIEHRLYEAGVRVPKINTYNRAEGFLFMEDIGSKHLSDMLNDDYLHFYRQAIDTIVKMQGTDTEDLPAYDADFLTSEMDLMQEWYLEKYLALDLNETEKHTLSSALKHITKEVLSQPHDVFVHRDYHSRNLMISPCDEKIVVIDYQDARVGPVTYDLVSLLRDVYVELDPYDVKQLAEEFKENIGLHVDNETFMRWFDFTGLQRHIKILGIFARLSIRDGKEGYLKDIPLTLKYIKNVAAKYPELNGLVEILEKTK